MKKSTVLSLIVLFLFLPATLYLGTKLTGRAYYFTGTLIIIEALLPFFFLFEGRKPQARELCLLAVLCALAVASRGLLAWLPHFKMIVGIIMISGIAFGSIPGFLVGAVSAFASNFLFGQGPWTPWQMMAYGISGFLAGILFRKNLIPKTPFSMGVTGFFTVFLIIGPLLDCSTLFTVTTVFSLKTVLAVFGAGVPANLLHALSTALTLSLLGKPMLSKLERIARKYGMLGIDNPPAP